MSLPKDVPEGAVSQFVIGDTTYCVCQEGTRLTESSYEDGWSLPVSVGFAKAETPIAYSQVNDKRFITCLNEADCLQDYEYDADAGEWLQGQLGILKEKVHPQTKIAACSGNGKHCIYFQNPSGHIQEIIAGEDGIWKTSDSLPPSTPIVGTSLAACVLSDSTTLVFYTNHDNSIHQIALKSGKWTDTLVPNTSDGSGKGLLIATPKDDNNFTLKFTNEKGECFDIVNGKIVKTGVYTENGFRPQSGAQYGDIIVGPGGTVIICGGWPPRGWPW